MSWYAVITTSQEEEHFCTYVNEQLHLHAVFPKAERHFRIQKEDVLSIKPMFAGCVLVESELDINSLSNLLSNSPYAIEYIQSMTQEEMKLIFHLLNEKNIVSMSHGIIVDRKPVVNEGPLKGLEEHVIRVNAHKRMAELNVKINGRTIIAGLEVKEKR